MTKNIFIVAIAVLFSVAFCSLSAQNVSKNNIPDRLQVYGRKLVYIIIFTHILCR